MFLSRLPGPFPGEKHGVHLKFDALSEIVSVGVCVVINLPGCRKTRALEYLTAFQISLFCFLAPLSTPLLLILLLLVSFFPLFTSHVCLWEGLFCQFSSYVLMNWRNAQSFTVSLSGNGGVGENSREINKCCWSFSCRSDLCGCYLKKDKCLRLYVFSIIYSALFRLWVLSVSAVLICIRWQAPMTLWDHVIYLIVQFETHHTYSTCVFPFAVKQCWEKSSSARS